MTELIYDAFISYASPDLAFAEEAYRRLSDAGINVWFDKARLNPGCDWHREIEHGCEASRVLLPVLTPRWKKSEWTKFETYGAEAVIPLIVEGDVAEIFTPPLTRFQGQAVDFASDRAATSDASWEKLFEALRTLLQQPAPDKLERLADLRYPANPYFVGRERELNQIHEELHQNPTAVLTQGRVRAIAALGGVGKTTLARQYAEKFWRCYPQIFWVDCRLGVESELARLCDLLLPHYRESTNVSEKARLALQALQTRDDRLLIYDNAEDEKSLQASIPKTGHCRTLITSRFAGWSAAIKSIHLYVLDPDPSHTLLATRAGRESFNSLSADEQSACAALAKELGYLPLALEQAAAYIEQQGTGFVFADYLQLYASAAAELLAEGVLGSTEYPDSVITTWKATKDKLGPAPRGILRLCSFLSSAPLPLPVLVDGVDVLCEEAEAVAGEPLPDVGQTELWVRKQVQQLRAYSMVEADGHSIMLHPLVQTVERHQLDEPAGVPHATLQRALGWIDAAFVGDKQDVQNWPKLDPLIPHVLAVCGFACRELESAREHITSRLLNGVGLLLFVKSSYTEAEPLLRQALELEQTFGESANLATIAVILQNLAAVLTVTGQLTEAEKMSGESFKILEIGLKHGSRVEQLELVTSLNNRGQMLSENLKFEEAERLFRRAIEICEHFDTDGVKNQERLKLLNNLGLLLSETNRLDEAEALMRHAVSWERTLADQPPLEEALLLHNLASILRHKREFKEAEDLIRKSIQIKEKYFDSNNHKIAVGLTVLADILKNTNRLAEADELFSRCVAINSFCFGEGGAPVAREQSNLAAVRYELGRKIEAETLIRQSTATYLQNGSERDYRDAVINLIFLAKILQETNRDPEAEQTLWIALTGSVRFHGVDRSMMHFSILMLVPILQRNHGLSEDEALAKIQAKLRGHD